MNLKISKHAKARMQQRGISKECIEHVLAFGKEYYRAGAFVYLATKKVVKEMIKKGVPKKSAARCGGVYVIIQNGNIQTVAHKFKRFKRQ
jgi:hypothetical protein